MARYATTDLHGCLATFRHLVENVLALTLADDLYLLGDYVNKGPQSRETLDYLLHLQAAGYRLHCLRGNHDQELLDAALGQPNKLWLPPDERALTLRSFGVAQATALPARYLAWLAALPFEWELPDYVLVHAGYDFSQPRAEMHQDHHTMLNIKHFVFDSTKLGGRRLLHGHVPTPTATVQARVAARAGAICLDAGGVYRHNPELRHLAAFNLDTQELLLVPNCEAPYSVVRR